MVFCMRNKEKEKKLAIIIIFSCSDQFTWTDVIAKEVSTVYINIQY